MVRLNLILNFINLFLVLKKNCLINRINFCYYSKKSAVLKTAYKHDKFLLNTDIDLDINGPVVHKSIVFGHLGWLLGYQCSFDTAKSALTRNNCAVGYQANDFTLHTNVNDGTDVGGSIYQKVNSQLGLGVSLSWSSVNNATRFALASKYQLDKYAFVQAKVNNLSQIGLSYTQELRPGNVFFFYSNICIYNVFF